jgi:hypothetical protein
MLTRISSVLFLIAISTDLHADDLQLSASVTRGDQAIDIVISVVDNHPLVIFPNINCEGHLITPDWIDDIHSSMIENGGVEFQAILTGADCPSTDSFHVSAWDTAQSKWLIEFSTPQRWQGQAELIVGDVPQPSPDQLQTQLPEGTVAGDTSLGLFLGSGPSERGIGPTSVVTGVVEGSIPALLGIRQGDLILHVDRGAGDPRAHIFYIQQGLERSGSADVAIRTAAGEERIVSLFAADPIVEEQLRAASRDDIFGPASDPISFRARLFFDGSFEALNFLAGVDWESYTTYGGTQWERILTAGSPPRYDHFVAAYGTARFGFLGACGDAVVSLVASGGALTQTLVGNTVVSETDTRYEQPFDALESFAPVIQATNFQRQRSVRGWTAVLKDFGPMFDKLECENDDRRILEQNLLAYTR